MSYADIINKKKKEWNAPDMMDSAGKDASDKIPFSSCLMNWSTYGGIPRGRISEFFGEPGAGKSTSSVDICKNAVILFKKEWESKIDTLRGQVAKGSKQMQMELEEALEVGPKKVLYIDLEHSFDKAWSRTLGINEEEIEIMQPPDVVAEEILQMVQEVIETGEIGLIVLDSIPSLVPRAELEKKFGERTVAALAGLLTVFFRKIVPLLTRYDTTMICINQVRDNMDNPYVVKTPGGRALEFYASLRIMFRIGHPVDFLGNELPMSTENPSGYIVQSKIVKQKSAPNDRKAASYFLMCTQGIVPLFDYARLARDTYGYIKKAAGWFSFVNPDTGELLSDSTGKVIKVNGMAKVYQFLQDNVQYYDSLRKAIERDISGKEAEMDVAVVNEED